MMDKLPALSITTTVKQSRIVNVAVAVIHYQQHYLLGYRHPSQHQGDRYEFVGGKIDANETAQAALIREVREETAIDISNNIAIKLGRLHHDYGDKQVCLHVYKVELSTEQYQQHKDDKFGLEGQAIVWVDKADLLTSKYDLPAANATILAWLSLPQLITITYPSAHFATKATTYTDNHKAWLNYHQQSITQNAWVYIRSKDEQAEHYASSLLIARSDIKAILPVKDTSSINAPLMGSKTAKHNESLDKPLVASHLNHAEVLNWFDNLQVDFDNNKQNLSIP